MSSHPDLNPRTRQTGATPARALPEPHVETNWAWQLLGCTICALTTPTLLGLIGLVVLVLS